MFSRFIVLVYSVNYILFHFILHLCICRNRIFLAHIVPSRIRTDHCQVSSKEVVYQKSYFAVKQGMFCLLFRKFCSPRKPHRLGTTPLMMAVMIGAIQNILSKGAKYSLFDPCKEMAYIPLGKFQQAMFSYVDVYEYF